MVIPIPPILMDILLSINIATAIIILLTTIYTTRPLDFSIFPGLLLITTLFRLSLNVSSTRLILATGNPGKVIETFGNFVTMGNIVVGVVIFIILVIIQFIVITKGSGRIAEVAARFTLDAMPGKQMAIDADLNAGLIDEKTARTTSPSWYFPRHPMKLYQVSRNFAKKHRWTGENSQKNQNLNMFTE
jgi:flagellar biosynthesis protein FlhA